MWIEYWPAKGYLDDRNKIVYLDKDASKDWIERHGLVEVELYKWHSEVRDHHID